MRKKIFFGVLKKKSVNMRTIIIIIIIIMEFNYRA